MNKPKEKWWSVTKFDVGRELANPDYVQWADERIAALEAEVAKFTSTNSSSPICPCTIQDIGIIPAVGQVHATIIFDKSCPVHGHIGR